MSTQKVSKAIIDGLSASKLTGNLPAIDGSALTGLQAFLKNTNDPTISSNPSQGVGTVWVNKTSGEMFVCTDATAGSNTWKNLGSGSGDIEPFHGGGTTSGYIAGG